jgi:putative xylitol transport system permease protein
VSQLQPDSVALTLARAPGLAALIVRAVRRFLPLLTVLAVVYGAMIVLSAVDMPDRAARAASSTWGWKLPTFLLTRTARGQIEFHTYNQQKILEQAAINVILGVGMTYVILTGGIDLSVGAVVALANVLFVGTLLRASGGAAGVIYAVAISIGAGMLCGLVNGLLVSFARIQAFIATLGMMMIAKGMAFYLGGSEPVYLTCPNPLPAILPIAISSVVFVVGAAILYWTVIGRHVYAVGGNAEASRIAGVRVGRVRLFCYVAAGLCAGLASIVLWSRVGTGSYLHGEWYELYAIAAVVIGGTSLFGGEGSVMGTLIGALIIAILNNGLDAAGIDTTLQKIVVGSVIVVAACWDSWRRRHHRRETA